jgi:hypothetical protein
MMHCLREAMADLKPFGPLGGSGKIVEGDTSYIGGKEKTVAAKGSDRVKLRMSNSYMLQK